MPTYEYACKSCGQHLEIVQSFKDDALTECPACGGPLRKVFGSIGIVFKGSGFYRTDSRMPARGENKSEPAKAETKTESPKADGAKSESSTSDTGKSKDDGGTSGGKSAKSDTSTKSSEKSA